jgi:hypothetical protein
VVGVRRRAFRFSLLRQKAFKKTRPGGRAFIQIDDTGSRVNGHPWPARDNYIL